MKKYEIIKDQKDDSPTDVYKSGINVIIPDIGQFPASLHWRDEDAKKRTFRLGAITEDYLYYVDGKANDISSTVMLDRDLKLMSDNFLGANDLTELVETNEGLLWISTDVAYWQRHQYVTPENMTPEIEQLLLKVDIAKLTAQEKSIYQAYLNNGPVKYSKSESLVAVICSDLDLYSNQLATIIKKMDEPVVARISPPKQKPGNQKPLSGKGM